MTLNAWRAWRGCCEIWHWLPPQISEIFDKITPLRKIVLPSERHLSDQTKTICCLSSLLPAKLLPVKFVACQVCCMLSLLRAKFVACQVWCLPSLLRAKFSACQVCCLSSLLPASAKDSQHIAYYAYMSSCIAYMHISNHCSAVVLRET